MSDAITFLARLAKPKKPTGGFGSGFGLCPSRLADQILAGTGKSWNGADLCAYMLARFGFPNYPSDDYKQLATWVLITPIDGIYLSVTPYLVPGSFLQFGFLYHSCRNIHQMLEDPLLPCEVQLREDRNKILVQWWRENRERYAFIGASKSERETCVLAFGESPDGNIYGLYLASKKIRKFLGDRFPQKLVRVRRDLNDLNYFANNAPESYAAAGLPPLPSVDKEQRRRERLLRDTPLVWPHVEPLRDALRATIKDLFRPVFIRDICINGLGMVPDSEDAGMESAERWEHAGRAFPGFGRKRKEANP